MRLCSLKQVSHYLANLTASHTVVVYTRILSQLSVLMRTVKQKNKFSSEQSSEDFCKRTQKHCFPPKEHLSIAFSGHHASITFQGEALVSSYYNNLFLHFFKMTLTLNIAFMGISQHFRFKRMRHDLHFKINGSAMHLQTLTLGLLLPERGFL